MPKEFVTFCTLAELPEGKREVFDLEGLSIVLFHVKGRFYAIENLCSHEEYELADGTLDDCTLECPKHGAHFDIRTGAVLSTPAYTPIKIFPVRVENEEVQVELEMPS